MKYKCTGALVSTNGSVFKCKNCGKDTEIMSLYLDENGVKHLRCGICDEIEETLEEE